MITLPRIFATGYQITAVGIYFNQVRLAERLKYYQSEDLKEILGTWVDHLKKISESFAVSVLETNRFLKLTGYKEPSLPQLPSQYNEWVKETHDWMIKLLPEDKLPRALYLYGFCIGEVMTILAMVTCVLDFQTTYNLSFDQLLVQSQNNLKIVQQRWGSIAKALGKVEDLQPFLVEYLKADSHVQTLFVIDINTLTKAEKLEHSTKLRNHIDFLENLMIKLQELLPQTSLSVENVQNPLPPSTSPDAGTPEGQR